jgi:hypothetical protein
MDQPWHCTLRVTQHQTKILLSAPSGDLLKARLNATPSHPRALLTLLEGLSLWNGYPLCVALSVDESCQRWPGSQLLGDELWPAESQLVRFDIVHPVRPRAKLSGLGDFRQARFSMLQRKAP